MSEPTGTNVSKLENVEEAKIGLPESARIVKMVRTVAGEIFKDKVAVRKEETLEEAKLRPSLWIAFEGEGFAGNGSFSIPELVTPRSSLGKFKARYGKYPEVGMDIAVHMNENGFRVIDL